MTTLPTWSCYCPNTTDVNAMVFELRDDLSVWFSYKTPVAFQNGSGPIVVRENVWGPTTGKHLNAIDNGDKGSRLDGPWFEKMLAEALR